MPDKICPPGIVAFNSLEPRPRSSIFDRALKAEIRDPLWMLARQWQMGEFEGKDAGTLVFSKAAANRTRLNRFAARSAKFSPLGAHAPLETVAERGSIPVDVWQRLQMGRQWLRLLKQFGMASFTGAYVATYPIQMPSLPADAGAATYREQLVEYAEKATSGEAWKIWAASESRAVDGWALYEAILTGDHLSDGIISDPTLLEGVTESFLSWLDSVYGLDVLGETSDAWSPAHLEYQFACGAPSPVDDGTTDVLLADEYHGGHLDWYSFDYPAAGDPGIPEDQPGALFDDDVIDRDLFTVIPAKIQFKGAPDPRWWAFEDGAVDFSGLDVNTTDVSKLLLQDFIFNYSANWFIVPYTVPIGSLVQIEGIVVQDVFGVRTLIQHANEGASGDWSMFSIQQRGQPSEVDTRLLIPLVIDKLLESDSLEEVNFVRDEMANMVWGIESVVPDGLGRGNSGDEAARLKIAFLTAEVDLPPTVVVDNDAHVEYVLGTSVPENWIPFIPNQVPGAMNRAIRLQRASMPRDIQGWSTPGVAPRTSFLRHGLDSIPASPYYINEEEVAKVGTTVSRSWQRTRWHNGRTLLWLGRRKSSGKGGRSSGLAFDQVVPKESDPAT